MKNRKKIVIPKIDKSKFLLKTRRVGYSALHALLMILFLYIWLHLDLSLSLESQFLKWQAQISNNNIIKRLYSYKYSAEDAIFVDVSVSREVAFDKANLKKIVITDRKILDTLFRLLNVYNEHKFILCDVGFDVSTDYDTVLDRTIKNTRRIGFPCNAATGNSVEPLKNLPGGSVTYSYVSNTFKLSDEMIKFRLIGHNGEKSLPLFMVESVEQIKMSKKGAFLHSSKKPHFYLNNMIVDDHINNSELMRSASISSSYTPEDIIGILRSDNAAGAADFLKGKIIVIGDMVNDMHRTAYGDMPGSLILYNIFLSVANGQSTITFWWIAFLFIMFTLLSYFLFYERDSPLQHFIEKIQAVAKRVVVGDMLSEILTNSIFLFLISLFSYFLFKKNIDLLALTLWLSIVEYALGRIKAKADWFKNNPSTLKSKINFLLINDQKQ